MGGIASTGPRASARGNVPLGAAPSERLSASTGPRASARGNKPGRRTRKSNSRLQRGRARPRAEIAQPVCRRLQYPWLQRGRARPRAEIARAFGFDRTASCFNGAARVRARKLRMAALSRRESFALQRGRARPRAEIRARWESEGDRRAASTGPRASARGNPCGASQWGGSASFNGAARVRARKCSWTRACMGSRARKS